MERNALEDFGIKIKYYRTKARMTQEELSRGIISVSYLSKIEGGVVNTSKEIRGLLCDKLKINPHFIENDQMLHICLAWFKHLLDREVKKAKELYPQINDNINYVANIQLLNLLEIHKLHYYLLTNNKFEADHQYATLLKVSKKFKGKNLFYWLKISGDYKYSKLLYSEALYLYQEAEKKIHLEQIYFPMEEKQNLYYLIATTASKLRNSYISIVYAEKTLEYYRSIYNLARCAECHILLGISYQRTNEPEKSIESFQYAATIAKNTRQNKTLSLSYQNIGNHYSKMNKPELAIDYFLKSYKLRREENTVKKITTISSLMKEYYSKGNVSHAKKWLKEGLELSKSISPLESIYVYEFRVYKNLIIGFDDTFEELINDEVVPFLEEKQLDYEKNNYLKILADYYFNNRKYKQAAANYQNSLNVLTKYSK
ncbi:helix-turn-helix domain-containing protein [Ornithinibacillus salinisoli]|uniref:Helix-turn-helix domain-containing protein n=1 Tax=Ornithinibacillus salinisoli TaxID=1848459 RepID=A0ABW4VWD8_9BACI